MRLRLLGSIAVALLPTISTTSSLNPFTWEEAERHESASSALLVADKARSTSRLTEVSHTSLPASRTSSNVCAISQQRSGDASPGPSLWTLLPVIAAAAFFLLGWHCGTRQAASAYALRTAEREDQFEQQAKADEAAEAEAAARLSTALVAVEAPINSEQRNGSIGDAVSLSSADSICEPAPAVDQDRAAESGNDVESSSNNAADPSQHHAQLESKHQVPIAFLVLLNLPPSQVCLATQPASSMGHWHEHHMSCCSMPVQSQALARLHRRRCMVAPIAAPIATQAPVSLTLNNSSSSSNSSSNCSQAHAPCCSHSHKYSTPIEGLRLPTLHIVLWTKPYSSSG